MAEGRNPVLKTHKQASDVLSSHLRETRGKTRKKSPLPPPTEEEIRSGVHRILEEFLKKQLLLNNNEENAAIPTSYQKVVVEDVIETDGPVSGSTSKEGSRYSSRTSCAKCRSEAAQSIPGGSIRSLTDGTVDFPFIDGIDDEEPPPKDHTVRSNSLPSSVLSKVTNKDEPSSDLSKSLSPSRLREILADGKSALNEVTEELERQDKLVDVISDRPSGLKDIEEVGITRGRQRLKSGTESSEDTDEEEIISPGRKKKSIFTRLRERMNRSLSRGRAKEIQGVTRQRSQSDASIKKRRKPRKRKDEGTSVDKKGRVIQNVHTHKHGHIEQHHYTNGTKSGMLVEKDVWETTDVTGESEHRHKEKHASIKESTELSDSDSGILRKLKKITSFRKSKKNKSSPAIKASKSDELDFDHRHHKSPKAEYNRSVSTGQGYQERVYEARDDTHHTTTTTVITGEQMYRQTDELIPEGSIQDEVRDRTSRNKSFVLDFDTCERQQVLVRPDGTVDTTVKQRFKVKHFDEEHDVEVDGNEDQGTCPRHAASQPSDPEKDRLYSAVAEKLAHIGDQYMATSPLSESGSSSVEHTLSRRVSARTPNLAGVDERDGEGLTELERQLRDRLREIGDSFALNMSPDSVKDAALEIAKHATYQTFQDTVNTTVGPGNSWDQIAAVFYLTKKAITLAGAGGAVAIQVKDLAAEFVADKFATWIVDQGGWDTCLDSDTDLEID